MPSRFPDLSADDVHVALFLPSGGVLLASRILDDLQRYLCSRGVAIHDQNAITELDDATVYFADGTTLEADLVVVAAGAWLPRFLPAIAHEVIPSRQTVVYFDLPVEAHDAWRTRPMILDIDKDSGFYLVPPVAGASLKVGDHRFNLTGDPRNQTRPEASEIEPIVRSTLHRLPEFANYPILRSDVCFYTVAPDERFRYVRQGRFRVVTGFSGHGFKFGPLIGERLAEMLFEERPELAFKRWLAGF
jgi:glycine/D-amino acid oxidase-like deaminating enzyme